MSIFSFLLDIDNYDSRKLGKTEINGIEVSTVYTSDEGYETAIIDTNGVHPVERYAGKSEAEEGHKKWCKKAKTLKQIIKLGGFMGIIGEEEIKIVRGPLIT